MWPSVLQDVKARIDQRLFDAGESIDVYLGASAGVPTASQINVIRGHISPGDEPSYCSTADDQMKLYIEIWINDEVEPEGETDVEYENNRTLNAYQRLATCSQIVRAEGFNSDEPEYESEIIRRESDQDQFRPTVAERIEYKIELKEA